MRLNAECVRIVLLELEKSVLGKLVYIDDFPAQENYSKEELVYSCLKLAEAGFVKAEISKDLLGDYSGYITDITYAGQDFLNKIRSELVWKKVKKIMEEVGCHSFDFVSTVAMEILCDYAKEQIKA